MKSPSVRLLGIACSLGLLTLAVACGSKSAPAAPSPTPPVVVTPTVAVPEPRTPIGGQQLDTLKPALQVNNAAVTGSVGTVTYEFWVSELDSFPDNSRSSHESGIAQGGDGTQWTPPSDLIPAFLYYWRARATNGTITTDWTATQTFKSRIQGFRNGQSIYDPLTDGTTVATRKLGGHFVPGNNGGWQSDSLLDGLDYDIPTCDDCTAEFDVTNFGTGEGGSISVDVKWFSMGDAGSMNAGFLAFRDSPWKMHLEQRSDGDGTGMQVIWRNGAADADTGGDPEFGDHRGKYPNGGPNWGSSSQGKVWHFTIRWTPNSYRIYINELGQPLRQWFPGAGDSGVFSRPYRPGNHRIELGCVPRGESMVGARYRNFKLSHN
jgi:hypothetical protein